MEEIVTILGALLAAFLIGSFPTAYLLVRKAHGKDLRNEGSGNIGTLNAFEVSRSKRIGAGVLVIDLLKGLLPVLAVRLAVGDDFATASAALLGVVIGHNYSPWIGWKGGRGLAPAAGASLGFNPLLVGVWGLFWLAGFWRSRKVHFGNIAATVLAPFAVLLATDTFGALCFFTPGAPWQLPLVTFLLCGLIFLKHLQPLRELIQRSTT